MNFNMSFFNNMALPIVVAACLILGYILKKWVEDIDNKWIPTILAVVGAVLSMAVTGDITVETIVCGAFSGLISTGLHQMFKQLIGGGGNGD